MFSEPLSHKDSQHDTKSCHVYGQMQLGLGTETPTSNNKSQVLGDNAKLLKKLREIQEQLAITSAKKEAFRAQVAC